MFLYQKLAYNYKHATTREDIDEFISAYKRDKPPFAVFDTETTGLNLILDKPFLLAVGYKGRVITVDWNKDLVDTLWNGLDGANLFAHNCKYDYHMVENGGAKVPETIKLYDSITVARLTEYTDSLGSLSLATLGEKYVDETAKFAGGIIKKILHKINAERMSSLRTAMIDAFPDAGFSKKRKNGNLSGTGLLTETLAAYKKRVQFIDDDNPYYAFIDENFKEPNYQDVYEREPNLMRSYACDDVVIAIEYLQKSLKTLEITDPKYKVLKREAALIRIVAEMEKVGMKVDVDYVLKCRDDVLKYRELLYLELNFMTNKEFSVGQHEVIKRLFEHKYRILLPSADEKSLSIVLEKGTGEAVDVARNIIELRTVDKWLSTYIDGKLNAVINGRIYTDINNNGAVSGRVSCDMQQQPKKPLKDREGNELFHPRKMFVVDEGTKMFFIDESQMELRVQAYYTMLHGKVPDKKMCQAYIPYQCKHYLTGERYDHTSTEFMKRWNEKKPDGSSVWETEDGPWEPTDLHTETTMKAFPELTPDAPDFKLKRAMGKQANFLKVYLGGVKAMMDQMGIEREVAEKLDKGFYAAFPHVKDYQDWVQEQASMYGYVENLYGRRYYMQDDRYYYKLCNYLIQGTCADMVKTFEVHISKYLKEHNLKTVMVLPVHDEIILKVPDGEEYIIPEIKAIMESVTDVIKTIPMVADVEYSDSNWGEKKGWSL